MSRRIWLDLTDASGWQGHLTGIQRVVFNVAEELARSTPDAGFFVLDPTERGFCEVGVAALGRPAAGTPSATSPRRPPLPGRLRARLRDRVSYMTRQDLHAIREASLRLMHRARPALPRLSRKRPSGPAAAFGDQDTVLVLGNFWGGPSLLEALAGAKQSARFGLWLMIYDLIPVYCPQFFPAQIREQYTRALLRAAALADGFFAISENSRRDMLRFCESSGVPAPAIEVVRLADDLPRVTVGQKPPLALEGRPFVLCVGTIEIRKNHALLYYAWKEARRRGIELPALVIVGQSGWYTGDVQQLFRNDPELAGQVFLLSGTADEELAWLYQNCAFTVFPSMYEGWGLPVAESLAYGKLCLSSNLASMPEVGGDLVEYFSPFDAGALLERVVANLDEAVRRPKEERIRRQYRPVSWSDVARHICDALAR